MTWANITLIAIGIVSILEAIQRATGRTAILKIIWDYINGHRNQLRQTQIRLQENNDLSYKILVKLESVENEVKFNGGKYKLVDAVKELKSSTDKIVNTLAIQASEREADMYVDPIPKYKTEGANKITFVNAAWCEMVGCTDYNRMLGHGWKQAVMPSELERMPEFQDQFEVELVPYYGEYSFRHLVTKKEIKTMVRTQVIKDKDGNAIGTMGTITIL